MKFLEKLGFSKDSITQVNENAPEAILEVIKAQRDLVTENIIYLKELGITNYQEIFIKYYDIFLLDNSNFKEIFDKYDRQDLIDKINKNINIVEYL